MRMFVLVSCVRAAKALQCRQSGPTLFCTGKWDGEEREGVEEMVVREWNRQWCENRATRMVLFARGATCDGVFNQCRYRPFSVNGKECSQTVSKIIIKNKKE